MTTMTAPVLKMAIANSILSITSAHSVLSFDLASPSPSYLGSSQSTPQLDKIKEAKGKAIKLVASGLAPRPKVDKQEREWEPVVASLSEAKILRMTSADTGEVMYERTTSKKGSCLSIESDGSVILSDKIGDVYSYPFIDESSIPSSSRPTPAPIPIEAATDPTLNPDAKLLAGHVSNVTAHLVLPRSEEVGAEGGYSGPWLVTADRDEHVRVSRYPDSYVIERYLFGHESFVSAIHSPSSNPSLLLTAGGDPDILIFHHQSGQILHRVPILEAYKPHRLVRAAPRPIRGLKGKKQEKIKADVEVEAKESTDADAGVAEEVAKVGDDKLRGLTDQEWAATQEGHVLPEGEGLCIGKIDSIGQWVVYFAEGASAVNVFRLPSEKDGQTETGQEIKTFALDCPVLDFVILPSSSTTHAPLVLVSKDPSWEDRVDGGKAGFGYTSKALIAEGEIAAADEKVFFVLQIGENGNITDVSTQHQSLLETLHGKTVKLSLSEALSIPAYPNLALLPRWSGMEDDDGGAPGADATTETDIATLTDGNKRRALGRLKAAGLDVAIPRTPEQKMRKHEHNLQKKKRRLEEKKAAKKAKREDAETVTEVAKEESEPAAVAVADVEMDDLEAEMNGAA